MSKAMVREHNLETGEVIDREMTNEEYEKHLANIKANEESEANLQAQAAAKAALLERLGITEEEAKLLLG